MRAEQKYWILSSNNCIQHLICRLGPNIANSIQIHYCSARMRGLFVIKHRIHFLLLLHPPSRVRCLRFFIFRWVPYSRLSGELKTFLPFFNLIIVSNVSSCRRHPLRPLRKSLLFSVIIIIKQGRFEFILFLYSTATSSRYHNNASAIHHGRVTMRRSHPPIL